jgi:hypothetical protein
MTPKTFDPLARRVSSWLGLHRTFLAADHVLDLTDSFLHEQYRRFYFRDIEAITVRQTPEWHVWSTLYGLLALLGFTVAMVGWFTGNAGAGAIVMTVGAVTVIAGLLALAINLARGPTAKVFVHTAAGGGSATGLARLKAAQSALARLEPIIRAAQRDLVATEVTGAPPPASSPADISAPSAQPAAGASPDPGSAGVPPS